MNKFLLWFRSKRAGVVILGWIARIFGAVVSLRGKLFDWGVLPQRAFPLPVICVGNLAIGGTGKTPHVEHILRLLHAEGYHVAMLSRGYGRKTRGFVAARKYSNAEEIGDEPYQMMCNCPFAHIAVCEKRVEGMERLLDLWPEVDVVVLDDAYQHRYIKPGFNVLLTDASRLYTADSFFPLGNLRDAPKHANRADAIVVTKCKEGKRPKLQKLPTQKLFYSAIAYKPLVSDANGNASAQETAGKSLLLITGIANPAPLKAHLVSQGAKSINELAFPDHHAFTSTDAIRMNEAFDQMSADGDAFVVTTQKDAARLKLIAGQLSHTLLQHLWVQPIEVSIEPEMYQQESFNKTILKYVRENTRNRRMD